MDFYVRGAIFGSMWTKRPRLDLSNGQLNRGIGHQSCADLGRQSCFDRVGHEPSLAGLPGLRSGAPSRKPLGRGSIPDLASEEARAGALSAFDHDILAESSR